MLDAAALSGISSLSDFVLDFIKNPPAAIAFPRNNNFVFFHCQSVLVLNFNSLNLSFIGITYIIYARRACESYTCV